MGTMESLRAVLRGGMHALRDPRVLARLNVEPVELREARFRREAFELLGSPPRTVSIEHFLPASGDVLSAFSFLDDTSGVLDLLLLRAIVRRYASPRYFEIGTFRGESARAVADAGAEVVTLSLSDETLLARGNPPDWVAAHRTISAGHPRIRHIAADSRTLDLSPHIGWADVLFIDGDHRRAVVESDTRRFWRVRAKKDSAVIWHDAFQSPLLPRWEVIAGIAAGLAPEARRQLVHVSHTLCMVWLPGAEALPTVDRSYVPRITFAVQLEVARTASRMGPSGALSPAAGQAGTRGEA